MDSQLCDIIKAHGYDLVRQRGGVPTPQEVAGGRTNFGATHEQPFSIGETGFAPATGRPPAGAIQASPLRFATLSGLSCSVALNLDRGLDPAGTSAHFSRRRGSQ